MFGVTSVVSTRSRSIVVKTTFACHHLMTTTTITTTRRTMENLFSTERLREWANKYWGDVVDDDGSNGDNNDDNNNDSNSEDEKGYGGHYIDLLSHKISSDCSTRLMLIEEKNKYNDEKQQRQHLPSIVSRAFFQSKVFAFESFMVKCLGFSLNNVLPAIKFIPGDNYLFFQTTHVTPYEIIFTWQLGSSSRGLTLIGLDTKSQLVYLGSGIEKSPHLQGFIFRRILLPFHLFYSNLLLKGMVKQLEKQTVQEKSKKHQ